jgi:PBP1b-binding outer membrane lipoprotein LpoB
MKKILIVIGALALAACSTIPSLQPATYANATVVDEQAATTAELAYKAWRLAATTGVQTGLIKGQTAAHVAQLDNQLYAALQAVESAYAAGNAVSIAQAVSSFNTALTVGYSAIGGR